MTESQSDDPRPTKLRGYPVHDGPYSRYDDDVVGVFETPDEYIDYLIEEGVAEHTARRKGHILGDMAFPLLMVEV